MAIRKRGDSWQVDVTVKGTRRSCTCATPEEAQKVEAQLRAELFNGAPVEQGKGWTLKDTYDRCMLQVWRGKAHANNVEKIYAKLEKHFGADTPMAAISALDVDAYFASMMSRGLANGTINRHRAVLTRMFSFAIERKEVSQVTSQPHMEHFKESIGRMKYFTIEEEKAITSTMRHFGYTEQADFVEFLLDTGARVQSDGFALTWDKVNFDTNVLVFHGRKCGKTTGIPMTKRVAAMLKARKAARPDSTHVWPYQHWWLRSPWDRVKEHLKQGHDPEWIPHTCRHTTASRLVQAGVPLMAVKEFLGHSSITVTMRYSHLAPTALLPCVAALEPTTDTKPPSQAAG
jgi:site-specific recombinase XerD